MVLAFVGALALILASVGAADHGKGKGKGKSWGKRSVEAKLTGYEEVPAVSSLNARGKIKLKIKNSTSIEYTLSYSGLSAPATQAHIHFAQWGVNGGIMAWLCDSATNNSPVATTPACLPGNTGAKVTITGTIVPADIQAIAGPPNQGIAAGEFEEAVAAIKAGVAYANVHTSTFPGGEIRGQLDRKKHDD